MPKFNKPTPSKINTIWATNAITGDVTEIDTSKIQQGWIQEKPPYESENWINQQHDQYIAYINQLGIPEWDQYTEYQAGKSYVQGSNNLVYKCTQTHVNKNPATAGNEAFWNVWEGNRQATVTSRGTVLLSTNSQASNKTSTTSVLTPSNIDSFLTLQAIKNFLNSSGAAPIYACRAWVNFDGTTNPPTIRSSGNISTISKVEAGVYVVNFNTSLEDSDYAVNVTTSGEFGGNPVSTTSTSFSTGGFVVRTAVSGAATDNPVVSVSVFR